MVSSNSGSSGLSGGAIAGIVIGSIVGVCLLCILLFFIVTFRSRHGEKMTDDHGNEKGRGVADRDSEQSAVGSTVGEPETQDEIEMA